MSYLLEEADKTRARRLLVSPGMAPRSEASYWGLWTHHPLAPLGYRVADLQPGEGECPAQAINEAACVAQL